MRLQAIDDSVLAESQGATQPVPDDNEA
jgi:hypothetical protein